MLVQSYGAHIVHVQLNSFETISHLLWKILCIQWSVQSSNILNTDFPTSNVRVRHFHSVVTSEFEYGNDSSSFLGLLSCFWSLFMIYVILAYSVHRQPKTLQQLYVEHLWDDQTHGGQKVDCVRFLNVSKMAGKGTHMFVKFSVNMTKLSIANILRSAKQNL